MPILRRCHCYTLCSDPCFLDTYFVVSPFLFFSLNLKRLASIQVESLRLDVLVRTSYTSFAPLSNCPMPYKTNLTFSMAFHPQTHGQTKRVNGILNQYLRNLVSAAQRHWAAYLGQAMCRYNVTTFAATKICLKVVMEWIHSNVLPSS